MSALKGIRVLDLGIITAGAATSALLADMGAEVIKVESPTYRDPFRIWVSFKKEDNDKLSPHFRATNRNKRALALNLKTAEGRACFMRLVAKSDVVVENFRRGVIEKLGIGYRELSAVNPQIVLASISSQGETGPASQDVSYGSTLESVAGMAWLTGYEGGDPMVSGVDLNYPDQVVALFAAGMVCTALLSRKEGNGGVHLDLSQRELTSFMISEAFHPPESDPGRRGNANQDYAFQDCFACSDGKWLAVSLTAEDVVGLCEEAGFDKHDIRNSLGDWAVERDAASAVAELQRRGIAAALSRRGEDVLAAAEWSCAVQQAKDGLPLKGVPFQMGDVTPLREAPDFGEDTIAILHEIAGYSIDEIGSLLSMGAVEAPAHMIDTYLPE